MGNANDGPSKLFGIGKVPMNQLNTLGSCTPLSSSLSSLNRLGGGTSLSRSRSHIGEPWRLCAGPSHLSRSRPRTGPGLPALARFDG